MKTLAGAVEDGTLRVPRLFLLESLVKFARRHTGNLRDYDLEIEEVIEALVARASVPKAEAEDEVAKVREALHSAGQRREDPTARPWQEFQKDAGDSLQLTKAEREKPICNDAGQIRKGSESAVAVTVEFYTDRTPGDLRHFCDPYRWHECSAYFRSMKRPHGQAAVDKTLPGVNGWRRDLIETVVVPQVKTLETTLRFTYSIDNKANPTWVHLDYVLPEKTADIVVDEGALDVRLVTSGPHLGRTRVSAKKAICFVDQVLQEWSTIACDTFWTEMVISTATGCPEDGGPPPIRQGN